MEIQCEECGVFNDLEDVDVTQGLHLTCKDKQSCKTRQRLRSREIIDIVSRRKMSQQDEAVRASYNPDYYHMKAKDLVVRDFNNTYSHTEGKADANMFYVVWFAKVLGNWKALVSTDIISGHYWEVTYNGAKQETYVDTYVKSSNVAISDEAYAALS
ncbi:hypothetical protein PBI_SALK_42 [Arthrobacter phage Salk]|nr:hypothetical protein PBI_STAYER_42 [Arthrobacter phage Stayer]QFG11756.1 hypothetical protein PBI_SALK_42 [Arthrobacter phage Salk]UVT31120.1 hypothetical protein PBI_LINDA_42 [Arthrobacter phage Linda]